MNANVNSQGITGFIAKNRVVIASVLSATASAGATYIVLTKRVEAKYALLAEQEIAEAKRYYNLLNKEGEYADPVQLAADRGLHVVETINYEQGYIQDGKDVVIQEINIESAEIILDGQGLHGPAEVIQDAIEENRNIFKDSKSANSYFDYEEEIAKRTPDEPYVITYDEFFERGKGYNQATLTYFEGDDMLADDHGGLVPDIDSTVGEQNILRFGHGSKDNNILYIRNELLEVDYEVIRDKGKYERDVLGLEEDPRELRHSHTPRKFRSDRE